MKIALIIVGACLLLFVSCVVVIGIGMNQDTDVSSCHYDENTNMSLITQGNLNAGQGRLQSSSRFVQGNACK